jgi:hypothetical protein
MLDILVPPDYQYGVPRGPHGFEPRGLAGSLSEPEWVLILNRTLCLRTDPMCDSLESLDLLEHPTIWAPALDDRFATTFGARHIEAEEEEEEFEDEDLDDDEEEDEEFDDDLEDDDDLDDDLEEEDDLDDDEDLSEIDDLDLDDEDLEEDDDEDIDDLEEEEEEEPEGI